MNDDITQGVDLSQKHNITYDSLPNHIQEGARRYIEDGIMSGKFLHAVLTNDFVGACVGADHLTIPLLPNITRWLYNDIPGPAWGSQDAVAAWMAQGGLRGKERAA